VSASLPLKTSRAERFFLAALLSIQHAAAITVEPCPVYPGGVRGNGTPMTKSCPGGVKCHFSTGANGRFAETNYSPNGLGIHFVNQVSVDRVVFQITKENNVKTKMFVVEAGDDCHLNFDASSNVESIVTW
jgi:hypothetical protein